MTYSIVAWDPMTGMTGVAAATKHLAVGATVPHAKSNIGAIATQAQTNPILAQQALDILETQQQMDVVDSLTPELIIELVLSQDPERDKRQFHLVDAQGRTAAWTGSQCLGWAGHKTFQYFSVAGNLLTGERVLIDMAEAYIQNVHLPFAHRLLQSLKAAQSSGGDRRGQQSAAIYITHQEPYPYLDLRVDHHSNPLEQLSIILAESEKDYYQSLLQSMPKSHSFSQRVAPTQRQDEPGVMINPLNSSTVEIDA